MVHMLIGGLFVAALWAIVSFASRSGKRVPRWGWILTVLGLVYAVFVAELIVEFLGEGVIQGVIVIGGVMFLLAVIWGVLLYRFVFAKAA